MRTKVETLELFLHAIRKRLKLSKEEIKMAPRRLALQDIQAVFTEIYRTNAWHGESSVSGMGSGLNQTATIRRQLPQILRDFNVHSMLDAACGDYFWLKEAELPLDRYVGIDIVKPLIAHNRQTYGGERRDFLCLNLVTNPLPQVDLILCRDCLVHLPLNDALAAIGNFKRSQSTFLLTTTFTETLRNKDKNRGRWRPLNLEIPPFDFPPPSKIINEQCTCMGGQYPYKCLGLWRLDAISV